jgi:hypothetical protein
MVIRRRPRAREWLVAAAPWLLSCNAVFGFEPGLPGAAVCSSALDCAPDQRCVDTRCVSGPGGVGFQDDAAVAGLDAAFDGAASSLDASGGGDADAGDSPQAACPDVMSDPANCGQCGNACGSGVCEIGVCRNPVKYGWPGQGASAQGVAGDSFVGVPLNEFTHAGWITAIGITTFTPGAHVYVGVYDDSGGIPGSLRASAEGPATTGVGPLEIPVTPPVLVAVGRYWLVAVFDQTISLALSGGTGIGWAVGPYPFAALPDASPPLVTVQPTLRPPPNVYVIVAQ